MRSMWTVWPPKASMRILRRISMGSLVKKELFAVAALGAEVRSSHDGVGVRRARRCEGSFGCGGTGRASFSFADDADSARCLLLLLATRRRRNHVMMAFGMVNLADRSPSHFAAMGGDLAI